MQLRTFSVLLALVIGSGAFFIDHAADTNDFAPQCQNLLDLMHLVPPMTWDLINLRHYQNDPSFRHAMKYMNSSDFDTMLEKIENSTIYKGVLSDFQRGGFDATEWLHLTGILECLSHVRDMPETTANDTEETTTTTTIAEESPIPLITTVVQEPSTTTEAPNSSVIVVPSSFGSGMELTFGLKFGNPQLVNSNSLPQYPAGPMQPQQYQSPYEQPPFDGRYPPPPLYPPYRPGWESPSMASPPTAPPVSQPATPVFVPVLVSSTTATPPLDSAVMSLLVPALVSSLTSKLEPSPAPVAAPPVPPPIAPPIPPPMALPLAPPVATAEAPAAPAGAPSVVVVVGTSLSASAPQGADQVAMSEVLPVSPQPVASTLAPYQPPAPIAAAAPPVFQPSYPPVPSFGYPIPTFIDPPHPPFAYDYYDYKEYDEYYEEPFEPETSNGAAPSPVVIMIGSGAGQTINGDNKVLGSSVNAAPQVDASLSSKFNMEVAAQPVSVIGTQEVALPIELTQLETVDTTDDDTTTTTTTTTTKAAMAGEEEEGPTTIDDDETRTTSTLSDVETTTENSNELAELIAEFDEEKPIIMARSLQTYMGDVLAAFSRADVRAFLTKKCEADPQFAKFYRVMRSKSFRRRVLRGISSRKLRPFVLKLKEHYIDVRRVAETVFRLFAMGPPEK